jgi:hypothetical protein
MDPYDPSDNQLSDDQLPYTILDIDPSYTMPKDPAGSKAEQSDQTQRLRPHNTQLRLNLNFLILHFKTSARNLPSTVSQLDLCDGYMRRILSSTTRDPEVRCAPSSINDRWLTYTAMTSARTQRSGRTWRRR